MTQALINSTLNVASPDRVSHVLRAHADQMRRDAAELASSWQDSRAGHIWVLIAVELERAADKCDKHCEKHFV